MAGIGAPEMLIVLVVLLVLFGGAQLPKLARSIGEAQRELRDGQRADRGSRSIMEE
jgi:sec-independent protein translocase protein TatA